VATEIQKKLPEEDKKTRMFHRETTLILPLKVIAKLDKDKPDEIHLTILLLPWGRFPFFALSFFFLAAFSRKTPNP